MRAQPTVVDRSWLWWLAPAAFAAALALSAEGAMLAGWEPPAALGVVGLVALLLPRLLVVALRIALLLALPVLAWRGFGPARAKRHPEHPAASRRAVAAAVIALAVLALGWWAPERIRVWRFERAARGLEPLVRSIDAYTARHGRPPATLGDLGPAYAGRPRTTGVGSCGPLEYRAPADPEPGTQSGARDAWELRAECPNGFSTWDMFYYRASGRYQLDGRHSRVGRWAYFWD